MSELDIIRAWKDVSYRRNLSASQLAQVPANPAGMIEIHETSQGRFLTPSPTCSRQISEPCPNC
jgi:mersacidin/lichenicidin family type 2 lantibiotic